MMIVLGLALVVVGLMMHFGVPIGKLPGDFHVTRGRVSIYFPLTSSILASLALMLVFMLMSFKR